MKLCKSLISVHSCCLFAAGCWRVLFHVIIINPTAGHHSVDLFWSFLYKIGKVPFVHMFIVLNKLRHLLWQGVRSHAILRYKNFMIWKRMQKKSNCFAKWQWWRQKQMANLIDIPVVVVFFFVVKWELNWCKLWLKINSKLDSNPGLKKTTVCYIFWNSRKQIKMQNIDLMQSIKVYISECFLLNFIN